MFKELNKLRSLFSRRDKLLYMGLFVMMIGGAFMEVVGVGAVPAFVATIAVPEKVTQYPAAAQVIEALGIESAKEMVVWGCLGLILVFIFKNLYLFCLNYIQVRLTEHHRVRLGTRLFSAYINAPYEFHLGRNSAELLRNVQTETTEIFNGVINPILTTLLGGLMTAGIVVLLIATTPWIGLVGIILMGGGSWAFLKIVRKRLRKYGLEARYERKESIKAINQGLGAFTDARILGREAYLINAYNRSIAHYAYVDRLRQVIGKTSTPILETIAVAGMLFVVLALILAGADTVALVPTLALFGVAIVRMRSSIGQVVGGISQVQYSIAAISNVVEDLNLLKKTSRLKVPGDRLEFKKALVLDGVTYAYPNTTRPALKDINLAIEKGSSVAFVGATGSGKTTLINVLLGLLQPQQGTIYVDDVDIHANLSGWNQNIGYIPQTIFLLDDTIRQNIAFGLADKDIDDDKLWTAIRAAQLDAFIQSLEEGVETVVGERGVRLSGGQRQRVGLARALYHNPEVLMMDEATSALDNQTESLVMEALEDLKEGRTFIIIAHRLSTVRNCDQLYFLRDGKIEASGTYDELARAHHDFRRMAEVA